MLNPRQLEYLKSRGYDETWIRKDGVFGVQTAAEEHLGLLLQDQADFIAWPVRTMAGTLVGVQTRAIEEKRYRWKQKPNTRHLPICFGTPDDYEILWKTGEVVLVEGAFDRLAVKQCFPERAVLARLSKGASGQLSILLSRYATVLWTGFDEDDPGRDAADQTELRLGKRMAVNKLGIPAHDMAKLMERKGKAGMRAILQKQFDTLGGW